MLRIDWRTLRAAEGEAARVETAFAADAPWFAGHFPGHPVLPAVAQLALVAQVRAREAGRAGPPAWLDGLRFRAPIGPGTRVELRLLAPDAAGAERFEIDVDGRPATRGSWRAGDAAAVGADAAQEPQEAADAEGGAGVDPAGLLPHTGPARWIRRVDADSGDPEVWTAIAQAPADSPFVAGGRAPAWLALELAAQAAAAGEAATAIAVAPATTAAAASGGAGAPGRRDPRPGYLVQARDVALAAATLDVTAPVAVRLALEGRAGPLGLYRFAVGGVARGLVGTYLAPGG